MMTWYDTALAHLHMTWQIFTHIHARVHLHMFTFTHTRTRATYTRAGTHIRLHLFIYSFFLLTTSHVRHHCMLSIFHLHTSQGHWARAKLVPRENRHYTRWYTQSGNCEFQCWSRVWKETISMPGGNLRSSWSFSPERHGRR